MSRSLQFDIVADDKASGKIGAVQKAAERFAKQMTGLFASYFSAQAIIGNILGKMRQSFDWGSSLKDNAAAVGLSVEEFQRLEYAAQQAGVGTERMQKAFNELRKTMRDANDGNKQAMAIMNAMGYTSEQVAAGNINLMDAFLRVSQAIQSASSEQERFNIATAVFGDRISLDLMKALMNYKELKEKIAETPLITKEEAETLDRMGKLEKNVETRMKVSFAQLMTTPESSFFLTGGASGFGAMALLEKQLRERTGGEGEAAMSPERARDMARELSEAAKKQAGSNSAGGSAGGISSNVPSLAAVGGAAGFVGAMAAASRSEQLLGQIEQNTRPVVEVPVNGQTNFTSQEQGSKELSAVVARMSMSNVLRRPRNIPR